MSPQLHITDERPHSRRYTDDSIGCFILGTGELTEPSSLLATRSLTPNFSSSRLFPFRHHVCSSFSILSEFPERQAALQMHRSRSFPLRFSSYGRIHVSLSPQISATSNLIVQDTTASPFGIGASRITATSNILPFHLGLSQLIQRWSESSPSPVKPFTLTGSMS